MLNKILVTIALLATLVTMFGCSTITAQQQGKNSGIQEITINSDEFNQNPKIQKEITLNNGEQVKISLASNASTGFSWNEEAVIADTSIMQQMSHQNVPSASDKIGAAGAQEWTFKALKAGITTLHLEYGRPWEGGEKGVWTFDLTITVK